MKIFGLTVERTKAPAGLHIPDNRGAWYPIVREGFAGAWQQNVSTPMVDVLSHPTVFACVTLITGDFAKTRHELTVDAGNDVWTPTENPAFSPVIRKPNGFQNQFQFKQQWMLSKLLYGNAYALKERDARGVVVATYVLDPCRVRPLIAPDGSVFYELKRDDLATQEQDLVIVPAREIIHDLFNPLFHPLVGISPLYAAGIPAILGLKILTGSAHFFGNGSMPGGIVLVPGALSQEKATDFKRRWEENYGGANQGKVAVLADGMKFETVTQSADKSQLNEQWLLASQAIADAFHVPFYLVGGPMPPYNNIQALNVQYYTQCLQPLFKSFEDAMDDGLGLTPDRINGQQYGVQLRTKDLLLMDSLTMMDVISKGVTAGVVAPNEGRADLNALPVEGGDTPYLQQQMWPLAQLSDRPMPTAAAPAAPVLPAPDQAPPDEGAAAMVISLQKELELMAA